MHFFKVKRIHVMMDGTIYCQCNGCEVKKGREDTCWTNEYYQQMTPLFDALTHDLVGFFNDEEVTVEFEDDTAILDE